jgi:glutaredoxin
MKMIKLYTSRNCPICVEVKDALRELPHTLFSAEENMADLVKEVAARDLDYREIRQAPAMVVEGCNQVWTGADCLIAIEDKEWEG